MDGAVMKMRAESRDEESRYRVISSHIDNHRRSLLRERETEKPVEKTVGYAFIAILVLDTTIDRVASTKCPSPPLLAALSLITYLTIISIGNEIVMREITRTEFDRRRYVRLNVCCRQRLYTALYLPMTCPHEK